MNDWLDEKWASAVRGRTGVVELCAVCGSSIPPVALHWVLRMGHGAEVVMRGGLRMEIRAADITLRACLHHEPPQPGLASSSSP